MLSIVDTLGQDYYARIKDGYRDKWENSLKN